MIPLLAELAADDRLRTLPDDELQRHALEMLEWPAVTGLIAAHCRSRLAAEAIRRRLPYRDPDAIARRHALADQLRRDGERDVWPPHPDIDLLTGLLGTAGPLRLEGGDLVQVAAVAADLSRLREHLLARADAAPDWATAAAAMVDPLPLAQRIERVLAPDGRLRDDASATLSRLRRQAAQLERQAREVARGELVRARGAGWTTGDEVVLRGERYCLPLRSGSVRRVPGIVHDRSASGGTLFVEPAAVVPLLNDLAVVRAELRAEEQRLLLELNRAVEQAAGDLREAVGLAALVDEVRAGLLWSRSVDGRRPVLAPGARLALREGRHPLLLGTGRRVVPLTLVLPEGCDVVVISGPNAGGKSVALKETGLACLLAQGGWDVPAGGETVLPLCERILVDLGDEQSIARSLSSFSAHLARLAAFLDAAGPGTLVLCDEIGSGTDPVEGAALAFAVLEALAARGATVVATTHAGSLKAAVADHPRMVNAAMEFDEQALAPRFTLRLGIPGASHAFAIARRLDLPPEILERAASLVGQERFAVERLLTELVERRRELEEAVREQSRLRDEAARLRRELAGRLEGLERERRRLLEQTRREGERLLAEARRTVEAVVRELRSSRADRTVVRRGHRRLAELEERLTPRRPAPPTPPRVEEGDRVRVSHLAAEGRVVERRGGKVVVVSRGLRLTVPVDAVEVLPPERPSAPARGHTAVGGAPTGLPGGEAVPVAIDLRGKRADEAWEELDRLIDRAIPGGVGTLEVIHGWGTGRLREALWRRLRADPRVASCREAPPDRGGHGCTIVELSD